MPRANATVPPEAIRIEDEVWQEAFARREPPRGNPRRRLQAIDGGQTDWLLEQAAEPSSTQIPASAQSATVSTLPAYGSTAVRSATTTPPPEPAATSPSVRLDSTATPAYTQVGAPAHPAAPVARRTVKIQGRGAERHLPWPETTRRRPRRRAYERAGFRPDRVAMWAVLLGFLLVLVAIASGHG